MIATMLNTTSLTPPGTPSPEPVYTETRDPVWADYADLEMRVLAHYADVGTALHEYLECLPKVRPLTQHERIFAGMNWKSYSNLELRLRAVQNVWPW